MPKCEMMELKTIWAEEALVVSLQGIAMGYRERCSTAMKMYLNPLVEVGSGPRKSRLQERNKPEIPIVPVKEYLGLRVVYNWH